MRGFKFNGRAFAGLAALSMRNNFRINRCRNRVLGVYQLTRKKVR